MTRGTILASFILLVLVVGTRPLQATPVTEDPEAQMRRTLRGLSSFEVNCSGTWLLPGMAEQDTMTQEQVCNTVMARFRAAGIGPVADASNVAGRPVVIIQVTPSEASLVIREDVTLDRSKVRTRAIIYEPMIAGKGPVGSIRDKLSDVLDKFISDYLAENPRRR